MDIYKDYPCDGRNYQKGRAGPVKYIVLHYVGALGGAEDNCKYYGREKVEVSAHYFVDHGPSAEVWQSVVDGDTAWHCGTTKGYRHPECRNANSIGIELCCHQDTAGKWYFDPETVDRAVELTRELMARYGIGPENVVRHYDVTGKRCPAPWVEDPEVWEGFKRRLEEETMTQDQFNKMFATAMREYELEQARAKNREVSPWHKEDWGEAERLGLMDGTSPAGGVLREQLAAVAVRTCKLCKGEK